MSVGLGQTNTSTTPLSIGCGLGSWPLHTNAVAVKLVPNATGSASAATSWTHPAANTALVYAALLTDADLLDFHTWATGDWIVPVNVTTANMNLRVDLVYVCRLNAAGDSQETLKSINPDQTLGSTGVINFALAGVSAASYSPGDRIGIYLQVRNTTTMTQTLGITFNQSVFTSITPPVWTQTDYRVRNDDGNESAATWKADANTAVSHPRGSLVRVRARVSNTGVGSSAFGWQYAEKVDTAPVDIYAGPFATNTLFLYGGGDEREAYAQSFVTPASARPITRVDIKLRRSGTPTDDIYVDVVSALDGSPLLRITQAAASVSTAATTYTYDLDGSVVLSASTTYFLRVTRSGAKDTANRVDVYSGGWSGGARELWQKDGGSWANLGATSGIGGAVVSQLPEPTWSPLPAQAAGSVPVRYANSTHLTDQAATTQQIGSGTFAAGRIYEAAHTATVTFTGAGSTELEAVVEVVDPTAAISNVIDFRVVREV